jgi:hypothetical protein
MHFINFCFHFWCFLKVYWKILVLFGLVQNFGLGDGEG